MWKILWLVAVMVAIKIGGCYECGIGTLLMNFQKSGFLIIYFKKTKKLKSTNQSINSTGNCEGLLFFFLFQRTITLDFYK